MTVQAASMLHVLVLCIVYHNAGRPAARPQEVLYHCITALTAYLPAAYLCALIACDLFATTRMLHAAGSTVASCLQSPDMVNSWAEEAVDPAETCSYSLITA